MERERLRRERQRERHGQGRSRPRRDRRRQVLRPHEHQAHRQGPHHQRAPARREVRRLSPRHQPKLCEIEIMTVDRLNAYGVLLLRLALGTMFLAHSIVYTVMTLTLAGAVEFFVSIGLPAWLAYATVAAEAVGGALLILGIQTRWVALALSPILLGAIWAHSRNG